MSDGSDVWDKVNGKISYRRMAAQSPKPVMEWPRHYPPYPPQNPDPIPQPRPKPGTDQRQAPPRRPPPRDPFRKPPTSGGRGAADPYSDPQSRDDLMRGAYQSGLNGDTGAASSFPPGSPYEREYQRGLRDRSRRDRSMRRYNPDAG